MFQLRDLLKSARSVVEDPANEVFVSVVSSWEVSISHRSSRSRAGWLPMSGAEALSRFQAAGFADLPVRAEHVLSYDALEGHHRDPFDRMLLAQARAEGMTLVTHDARLRLYGPPVLYV